MWSLLHIVVQCLRAKLSFLWKAVLCSLCYSKSCYLSLHWLLRGRSWICGILSAQTSHLLHGIASLDKHFNAMCVLVESQIVYLCSRVKGFPNHIFFCLSILIPGLFWNKKSESHGMTSEWFLIVWRTQSIVHRPLSILHKCIQMGCFTTTVQTIRFQKCLIL